MELTKHIRELLFRHDCVIVPGFGGFVTNPDSARIDNVRHVFYPPSKKVGFNRKLDHNDGLLASHISSKEGVSYTDANKLVETSVNVISKELLKGRNVSFEGIGEFFFDKSDNLQFEPDPLANFSTESYGLTHFRFPPLKDHYSAGIADEVQRARSRTEKRGMNRYIKYAVAGLPIVAVIVFGSIKTDVIREFRFDISSLNPFSVSVESKHTVPGQTERIGSGNEKDVFERLSSQREALYYEEEDKESVQGSISKEYFLVAGSFRNYNNAVSLEKELEGLGYEPVILESQNGMYRVAALTYTNRDYALRDLPATRQRINNPDIWLLSK